MTFPYDGVRESIIKLAKNGKKPNVGVDIFGFQGLLCAHNHSILFVVRISVPDRVGGKVTLGGLERWFSPRGQDLAFLLSCIGLVRPSSSADLKQNKNKQNRVSGHEQTMFVERGVAIK
jgi:hypothetical protein